MRTEASGRNGLLRGVFFLCLSMLPFALVCGGHTWLILAIWAIGSGVRLKSGDRKASQDCVIFWLISVLSLREDVAAVVAKRWDGFEWMRSGRLLFAIVVLATPLALGLLVLRTRGKNDHASTSNEALKKEHRKWNLDHPKPLLFPCRTTHARIFPKKHAFGYTYLLCGFPIIPAGTTPDGADIGDGSDKTLGGWWLRIRAEDYLERGYGDLGFYGKLQMYLRDQGVDDAEWSYAYLTTAPRFFGYSFNPVSFWYIYNQDHELKKMVLEVNNTFGERRIYLLDGSSPPSPPRTPESEIPAQVPKARFTDIWMKDFHVSPFNSRKGSYALKALNPFPSAGYPDATIDNTITLKSSKDHGKLVARIYTTGKPLDPATFGLLATLRFMGNWWWVGFVTFPRILKEAFKLFFRRSLHVWFRPEVLSSSIGRGPTATESALQEIFRDYLDSLVHHMSDPICINYQTAIPDRPKQEVTITHLGERERNVKNLEIRILTPVFYSRFVHYAHTSEAFDRECLFTDEKNRTLWISQPELVPQLLGKPQSFSSDKPRPSPRSYIDELRWTLMKKLRCPPAEPAYPVTPKSAEFNVGDIRTLPYSELDKFVRGLGANGIAGSYRRMVTKIFLAQRFAFGFMEVIDIADFVIRITLCWMGSMHLISSAKRLENFGTNKTYLDDSGLMGSGWWWMPGVALYVSGCHVYGLLKGYS